MATRTAPQDCTASTTSPACARHGMAACSPCHGLDHDEWSVLDEAGRALLNRSRVRRTVPAGQSVFVQGEACTGLHCIDAGEVALRKSDPRAGDSIVRIAHAGQTLGHRAYFA